MKRNLLLLPLVAAILLTLPAMSLWAQDAAVPAPQAAKATNKPAEPSGTRYAECRIGITSPAAAVSVEAWLMPILKESFSESLIEIAPVYAEYHPVDDLLEVEEIGSDPGSGFVELRLRVNLDIEILEADVSAQADAAVEDKQEKLRRVELPAVARETLNATLAKVLDRLEVSNKLRQMPVERRLQLRRAELNRLDQERLAMTRRLDEFGVKQPLNLEATERLQYETARLLDRKSVV